MNLISLSIDLNDLVRKLLGFQFYRSSRVLLLQEIRQDSFYEVITILLTLSILNIITQIWIHSEQHLVDCDTNDGGCNGGWYTDAWDYLKTAGGSAKLSLYSYTGVVSANVIFDGIVSSYYSCQIHHRNPPLANTLHPC